MHWIFYIQNDEPGNGILRIAWRLQVLQPKTAKRSVTQPFRSVVNLWLSFPSLAPAISIFNSCTTSAFICGLSFADELIKQKRSNKKRRSFSQPPPRNKRMQSRHVWGSPKPSLITVLGRADCDWMPFLLPFINLKNLIIRLGTTETTASWRRSREREQMNTLEQWKLVGIEKLSGYLHEHWKSVLSIIAWAWCRCSYFLNCRPTRS